MKEITEGDEHREVQNSLVPLIKRARSADKRYRFEDFGLVRIQDFLDALRKSVPGTLGDEKKQRMLEFLGLDGNNVNWVGTMWVDCNLKRFFRRCMF